ncbi:hypothetical protein ACQR23_13770, partial [Clostridium perfringens]
NKIIFNILLFIIMINIFIEIKFIILNNKAILSLEIKKCLLLKGKKFNNFRLFVSLENAKVPIVLKLVIVTDSITTINIKKNSVDFITFDIFEVTNIINKKKIILGIIAFANKIGVLKISFKSLIIREIIRLCDLNLKFLLLVILDLVCKNLNLEPDKITSK